MIQNAHFLIGFFFGGGDFLKQKIVFVLVHPRILQVFFLRTARDPHPLAKYKKIEGFMFLLLFLYLSCVCEVRKCRSESLSWKCNDFCLRSFESIFKRHEQVNQIRTGFSNFCLVYEEKSPIK